jgi:hypothetical protein
MNAERLHAICIELQDAIDSTSLVTTVRAVANTLQAIVNQPAKADVQATLTTRLDELYDALGGFPTDQFSPAWRQALEELGGSGILGEALERRVKGIMAQNGLTPATALAELQAVSEEVKGFSEAIDGVISSFEQLNIGAEELEPGECELGVLIPRSAVHNGMSDLGSELHQLDLIFATFSELTSGERESLHIRTISSTDYMMFLEAALPLATCVSVVMGGLIVAYKNILEIKVLKNGLRRAGVKDAMMEGITEHANSAMEEAIEEIVSEVVEEYYANSDEKRKNELAASMRISLRKLANRIDKGYNVEVRVKPLDLLEEGDDESSAAPEETVQQIERVLETAKILEFVRPDGDSILQLPEGDTDSVEDSERS